MLQFASDMQVLFKTTNKLSVPLQETHWLSTSITLNSAWQASTVMQVWFPVWK
jgi:hypothetical protein